MTTGMSTRASVIPKSCQKMKTVTRLLFVFLRCTARLVISSEAALEVMENHINMPMFYLARSNESRILRTPMV